MLATESIEKSQTIADFDQRVILHDVSWKEFEREAESQTHAVKTFLESLRGNLPGSASESKP